MAKQHIIEWQRRIGVVTDGDFGPKTLARSVEIHERSRRDECPPTLKDGSSAVMIAPSSMRLCERALDWCLEEASRWTARRVDDTRVAEYFAGCMRDGKRIGGWLASEELKPGVDYSFCAAAQGFAEFRASLPDEERPPWRAGALEIMRDAIDGKRPGERWLPLADILAGARPNKGAILVYGNTQVVGKGHVERLIDWSDAGYRCVGANENNRRWVIDAKPIALAAAAKADGTQRLKLLGAVVTR